MEQLIDDLVRSAREGSDVVSIKPIVDVVTLNYPALAKDFVEERVIAAILRAGGKAYWENPREGLFQSNRDDAPGSEA